NGSGYPTGLQGTQIPLEARLIAVIDSFHAIVSERPYKKAMPVSYALDQLRLQAGTNFDPDLIEIFCSIIDGDGNILPSAGESEPVTAMGHAASQGLLFPERPLVSQ
ncbi:MAG: HD domain-containing phosphohydrolase, partial [Acidobacteriota bacterium]